MRGSVDMNLLFTLGELARMVRAYADKQAARYGITRAQWAVLAKVERTEGLKQSELAEQMEMQNAARPLLGKLAGLRSELTATALEGINPTDAHRLLAQLDLIKENVRNAIQNAPGEPPRKEQRVG